MPNRQQIEAEEAGTAVRTEEESSLQDEAFEDRILEQYERLKEEEMRTAALLQEMMENGSPKDEAEQARIEELEASLRGLRVQEQVLRARLLEMGNRSGEDSIKNP